MKKKGKYLNFYYKCINNNYCMNEWGLCEAFRGHEEFNLIDPERGENNTYWGYGDGVLDADYLSVRKEFTPLRQTIVLLMAAMNNEL